MDISIVLACSARKALQERVACVDLEVAHPVDNEAVESALDCNIDNLHTALHHTHHTNSVLPCCACVRYLHSLILTITHAFFHAFNTCLAVGLGTYIPGQLAVWGPILAVSTPAIVFLDLASIACGCSCTAAAQAERAPSSRNLYGSKSNAACH